MSRSGISDSRSASRKEFLYRLAQLEAWPKAAGSHCEATGREGLLIQVWVGTCYGLIKAKALASCSKMTQE